MSKQEFIKTQTCVLRVNIQCDCDGCRNKVKKLLLKVDGVYTVSIDAKQGKVTVAGNVDPAVLIQKLEKSGKHAELWGGQKGNNQFNLTTQFKNLQMDSGKGGHNKGNNNNSSSNNKTQKGGGGGGGGGKDHQHQHQQHQKGGHGQQMFQPQMQQHHNQSQQMKGSKDQKSVKFNVPQHANPNNNNNHHFDEDFEDGDDDDDDDDDEYDDEDEDGYDDEFEDEENELDDVFGQSNHSHAKNNIHVMGNNAQKNKANGKTGKDKKSGGGNGGATKAKKSSGGFSLPAIFKSIAGNGNADNKKSNGSKKGNNGHGNNNTKGGNHNKGGNGGGSAAKHGGKGDAEAKIGGKNGGGGNNKNGGANNGPNNGNGKKGGGGGSKGEGFHEMSVPHHNGKGNGNMGPMGHNNIPAAAHGLPAAGLMNGGGYYNQGMMMGGLGGGPPPAAAAAYGNPYANQQYMAMMMNQQRMNGEGMHPQMMYGRPPAYMTPMPPPPVYDPVTHIFSDENTGSCSIM